jgi:hypothetical protein
MWHCFIIMNKVKYVLHGTFQKTEGCEAGVVSYLDKYGKHMSSTSFF